MAQRIIDVVLALLGSAAGFLLSWPFWRSYSYWAESRPMWLVYFVLGYLLVVYVFYAFIVSLRTLFKHDALGKKPAGDGKAGEL